MFGTVPVCTVPVWILYRTSTEVSDTGTDVVPKLPKWYWCCTELTEVSGTGMKFCTVAGGTGILILPNLPKHSVPEYGCCTELTDEYGTGIDVVRNYQSVRCRY